MVILQEAERVARLMAPTDNPLDVQIAQTLFRMRLVEKWQIPRGATILEVGCGQGDMTAVLASAVGSDGHVTAVDIAAPEYGAPVTLGRAAAHLQESPLGPRIDFHFQCDLLEPSREFPVDAFDYVVLAHCSWYFVSLDHLRRTLLRVRPWARRLCYSEWDMEPRALDQVGHLLAVLIQGQIGAYDVNGTRNVRTPFSKATIERLLEETEWATSAEAAIDASSLKDADWEIDDCLKSCENEADALGLPLKVRGLLASQIDVLRSVAGRVKSRPLPSYWVLAERAGL